MINVLDIIFIAVAAFFVLRGLFRGLARELASIIAVVLGYIVASNYTDVVVPYLKAAIHNPGVVHFVAYLVAFFGTVFGVKAFLWLFSKVIKLTPFGFIDIPAGAVIGFGKALVLCCAVLLGLSTYLPDAHFLEESRSREILKPGTDFLAKYMSEDMQNYSPSRMTHQFEQEKQEYMENFLSGGSKDEDGSLSDDSMEIIKKMGESLKDLKKEE